MSGRTFFTDDFKAMPYWWENAPLVDTGDQPLPKRTDVLVIGSGYTGLQAAIQTARAGMDTLVIDAEKIGWGCSSRNGGQISTSIKPSYTELKKTYGEDLARALLLEGQASLDYMADFISAEKLDCDFSVTGRFHGAHTQGKYEDLCREAEAVHPVLKIDAYTVPKTEQHKELGTDAYHGGIVYPHHASIDPGKYHMGLVRLAKNAGAKLVVDCRASAIQRESDGFEIETSQGKVKAKKVVLATNGYSGPLSSWHRKRIMPIGSYIIATEELPKETMDRLFPTNRILSDTRKLVYYYRVSPDRKRVLFGGRVSLQETDPLKSAPMLHRDLVALFPELETTKISHSWAGFVGYTFDKLAHVGEQDGLFYAMGYCGSGVGMASYLGMKTGRQVFGKSDGNTAFAEIPFNGRPYYSGKPWFLAPTVMAYRIMDRLGI